MPGGQWLKVSQQCAIVAKQAHCTLRCLGKSVTSRPREVILLLYLALMRPYLGSCVQSGTPQYAVNVGPSPAEAPKALRGLEDVTD